MAEIIQRVRPDVLLINEFDFEPNGALAEAFQENYLSHGQNGADPIEYDYWFVAPSNTGVHSGLDFDNNGIVNPTPNVPSFPPTNASYGNDSFGFGDFPGQFGMAVFSRFPIRFDEIRTFQHFLWKDMPNAMLPDDPTTAAPADWYSPGESSTSSASRQRATGMSRSRPAGRSSISWRPTRRLPSSTGRKIGTGRGTTTRSVPPGGLHHGRLDVRLHLR